MALPDPTALTNATRFHPTHFRTHSRSPSRSPVRKARFTTQHLDPLLNNLSPDSTLKALQATETIPADGTTEDVLAKSIADATTEEREIGIRAAFAAQKLKQWRTELTAWLWPGRRDRGLGTGFLQSPEAMMQEEDGAQHIYVGYLPLRTLNEYEEQIEDIKDGLESLEMEELKDHVLTAHASNKTPAAFAKSAASVRGSYGRMRDFTALVTATVIQALPDLATLNLLIDTWDVRIAVLREVPMLLDLMDSSREAMRKATASCHDPSLAPQLTVLDYTRIRDGLGNQIKDLGRRIDKLLDLLEHQDDALPQSWIDLLEKLELDFATWSADAERLANENAARVASASGEEQVEQQSNARETKSNGASLQHQDPGSQGPAKPALELKVPSHAGHKRETSEVSIADSVLSAVSVGEIVDARKSQVMLSPRINVVESPAVPEPVRPPTLQRASTASIEVVSKDQLKRLDVRRSMSADLLAKMGAQKGDTTPTRASMQLCRTSSVPQTPLAELEDPHSTLTATAAHSEPSSALPTPSLMVDPLHLPEKVASNAAHETPVLPRRSSKRNSLHLSTTFSREDTPGNDLVSPVSPEQTTPQSTMPSPISPRKKADEGESLDWKIKDILQNLPTKIRLANRDGSMPARSERSAQSSRSTTPVPALVPESSRPTRRGSAAEPGIRIYHLHQNGQARDAKPIKLFVRAVGENGERVMVRVGGGWADLAEYLREYSAHHGRRSTSEGLMEVAQYPAKTERERKVSSQLLSPTPTRGGSLNMPKRNRRRSLSGSSSGSRSRSPSPPPPVDSNTTPPVPPIPAGYTMHTPTMSVMSKANGHTDVDFHDPDPTAELKAKDGQTLEPEAGPYKRSSSMHVPGVTTTTTVQSPAALNPTKYVPLGGAGPKTANRRSATYGAVTREQNDAWVEGMVGKARAVSAGSQTVHGPTTTTTTTVTSTPGNRRASGVVTTQAAAKDAKPPAAATNRVVSGPAGTSSTAPQRAKSQQQQPSTDESQGLVRRKSRLGIGENMSGIKRVFLRRKSTK